MKHSVRESIGIVGVQSEFTVQEVIVLANFRNAVQKVLDTNFKDMDTMDKLYGFATETVVLLDKLTQDAKPNEAIHLELFAPYKKEDTSSS
jgi:hypothetical protein